VNGYFVPSTGGLSLYTTAPCRVLDTRNAAGAFNGVAAVLLGDVELGVISPFWGISAKGKPPPIRRKTDRAVNVQDQLPWRAPKDGHGLESSHPRILGDCACEVEIIPVGREGQSHIVIGDHAQYLHVGIGGDVPHPQGSLAILVLHLGQKFPVRRQRSVLELPDVRDLADRNRRKWPWPRPQTPSNKSSRRQNRHCADCEASPIRFLTTGGEIAPPDVLDESAPDEFEPDADCAGWFASESGSCNGDVPDTEGLATLPELLFR
jgi:hypothetical protein